MRKAKTKKKKQVVYLLLPLLILLGVVMSILPKGGGFLKADDSKASLVDVYLDDQNIAQKDYHTTLDTIEILITSKEDQLFQFENSEDFDVIMLKDEEEIAPVLQASKTLTATNTGSSSASTDVEEEEQLFVIDGETTTYLQLYANKSVLLRFTRQTDEELPICLQVVDSSVSQVLLTFDVLNDGTVDDETSDEAESSEEKSELVDSDRESFIEDLEQTEYTAADSFKTFEYVDDSLATKTAKSGVPVKVTDAKLSIKTGTGSFDANNNPGYDSSATNDIVRSFDSINYLVQFSLESTDATTSYTDIRYRVDMTLPEAYGLDSDGKLRFNAEVIDNEHGSQFEEAADGSQTSFGYVESTISGNGFVGIPITIDVYGAKHGTILQPEIKITILSAKNSATGEVEEMDIVYDKDTFSALSIKETMVSAKASISIKLASGKRTGLQTLVQGLTTYPNWEALSIGSVLSLVPLSDRGTNDFRGATFPSGEITYNISTTNYYKTSSTGTDTLVPISTTAGLNDTNVAQPASIMAASISTFDTTQANWQWTRHNWGPSSGRTLAITSDFISISIPLGKTEELHFTEPQVSLDEKKLIGVYDSGDLTYSQNGASAKVTMSDYTPVSNPYTYTMSGGALSSNEKMFSSSILIMDWSSKVYLTSRTGIYTTNFFVSDITYEGDTYTNPSNTLSYSVANTTGGDYTVGNALVKQNSNSSLVALNSVNRVDKSDLGDAQVEKGTSGVFLSSVSYSNPADVRKQEVIMRWNANTFQYDTTRDVWRLISTGVGSVGDIKYGVHKGTGTSKNTPVLTHRAQATTENEYTWYNTPEAALASGGVISAVKAVYNKEASANFISWLRVPVEVVGIAGAKDQYGNPNVFMTTTYSYNASNNLLMNWPGINTGYTPSTFDSKGTVITNHNGSGHYGESVFIKPFSITTTTAPEKSLYKTTDTVDWKVQGIIASEANQNYVARLTTTLPVGLEYDEGSAKDTEGNLLSTVVTKNADGTTTLVWEIDSLNPTNGDLAEVHFSTSPVVKDLSFNEAMLAQLSVKTVGELWLQSDPSQYDIAKAADRTSSGKTTIYLHQQVVLRKWVDKVHIETGTVDAANIVSTDIEYTIDLINNSTDKLLDVRLLDVLPYNTDSLGTDFNGSYTVKSIEVVEGDATIQYTDTAVSENADPNSISGWSSYTSGVTSPTAIANATGVLISSDLLEIGDSITVKIVISPTDQAAGDIYRNRASVNSYHELLVRSNIVETKVYGRKLSGIVWYDDKYDGLLGNTASGAAESRAKDIPVKLYRSSLSNPAYKDELVEENLLGEAFIDGSGDSLVKTNANGEYEFTNLPEGDYVVEFIVGDKVIAKEVKVTKQLVGDDETINSKADEETYLTPDYTHPVLSELNNAITTTDSIYHIPYVNLGLIRPSTVNLFKYEAGSAQDTNGNGVIDEEEKATGSPLIGAGFDLYDKDGNKLDTQATDSDGNLSFSDIFPGEYTLVETKSPEGYELVKREIPIEITQGNTTVQLYQDNAATTVLPFTGSNKMFQIVLIAAASILTVGLTGVVFTLYSKRAAGKEETHEKRN